MDHIPLMLNIRVDNFFNIVDFFGYAKNDTDIAKIAVLQTVTKIIDFAQEYSAYPLEEDRVRLHGKKKNIGISFSLIFKNRDILNQFLDNLRL